MYTRQEAHVTLLDKQFECVWTLHVDENFGVKEFVNTYLVGAFDQTRAFWIESNQKSTSKRL